MLERLLKPNYTKFLVAPIVKSVLIPRKVTPNTVTFFGVLFGLIAGFTIAFHQPFLGIITLLLSGYADTLDGQLATLTKQQTDLGCIYDIVSDRIVEIAIIFGLYFYAPNTRHLYTMLMIASILVCIKIAQYGGLLVCLCVCEIILDTQSVRFLPSPPRPRG